MKRCHSKFAGWILCLASLLLLVLLGRLDLLVVLLPTSLLLGYMISGGSKKIRLTKARESGSLESYK